MTRKTTLSIIFTFLMTAVSQTSFAGQCDMLKSDEVAFFQHGKYQGACVVRNVGRYANAKSIGIGNDKISSVKLGSKTKVVLCKDSNFKGGCKTYTKSMSSIKEMNDKTSSAIIVGTLPAKESTPSKPSKTTAIIKRPVSKSTATGKTTLFDEADALFGRRSSIGQKIFLEKAVQGNQPSSLTAQAGTTANRLVMRKQSVQSTGGPFSITARCNSGEVRLGGGYKLSQPPLNSDEELGVESNYPSGSNTWTVSGNHKSPNGTERYISAEAYCMQNDGVSLQTIASPIVRAQPNVYGQFYRADSQAVCPGTKILTGGGFRTVDTGPNAEIHNAGLSSFFPVENSSGQARGWRAAMDLMIQSEQPPTLQTFVVCVDPDLGPDRITAGRLVTGDLPRYPLFGYTAFGPRTLQCPAGETALSGGYRFGDSNTGHADLFVPHQILESHTYSRPRVIQRELPSTPRPALSKLKVNPRLTDPTATVSKRLNSIPKSVLSISRLKNAKSTDGTTGTSPVGSETFGSTMFKLGEVSTAPSGDVMAPDNNPYVNFGGWTVSGIFGSQTQTQTLTGYAACFKLPRLRFTVEILTPQEGFTIGPDFSASGNGTTTTPMSMTASGSDTNGQAVPNLAYIWYVDGALLASGASVSSPITTQSCGVDRQTVKVVARDSSGRTASDEVSIMVGQIC